LRKLKVGIKGRNDYSPATPPLALIEMEKSILQNKQTASSSRRQQIFFRYAFFVLVDLTVLNLADQYWELVFIESFSISLLTALLLQILLQATMAIEHRIADYFREKPGLGAKILRGLATWAVLFGSKLVILEAINISFGNSVLFGGPMNGLISFVIVVVAIIVAEQLLYRIYKSLA
jgi:hypothetical protein